MKSNLAEVVHMFGEDVQSFPYLLEDAVAEFPQRAPLVLYKNEKGEIDYDKLFDYYKVEKRTWKEKIANLKNANILREYKGQPLEMNWVTSADELAARSGIIDRESIYQLAAIGVVRTLDNNILLGVRGGDITPERVERFASGLYSCLPGGSVAFRNHYTIDPITDTIVDEFHEEIGNFAIVHQKPIGICYANEPGPTGYKFISFIETDATLAQLQKTNALANTLREELLAKGASSQDVVKELENKNLPKDSWEHDPLIGVYNDKRSIKTLINTQPQSFSGIGVGSLSVYLESIK